MKSHDVAIIAIGDELISGKTLDTNSQFIAQSFEAKGLAVANISLIPDQLETIIEAIKRLSTSHSIVVTTGGLGPTSDDLTRDAVAIACGKILVPDQASIEELQSYASRRNRQLTENNSRQALFPESSKILRNNIGTANAFISEINTTESASTPIVSLPGVPAEMKKLMTEKVIPWVNKRFKTSVDKTTRHLRCFGVSESYLGSTIECLSLKEGIKIAYRPSFPEVMLQISAQNPIAVADRELEADSARQVIIDAIGLEFFHAYDDSTQMAESLTKILKEKGISLAIAESCSGGLVAHKLVSIADISSIFKASLVTYDNDAKQTFLGVKGETLKKHGAVSEEVACAMAYGARVRSGTDIAVSITGIAGPDGGSEAKPVGTVWIGISRINSERLQETKLGAITSLLNATH